MAIRMGLSGLPVAPTEVSDAVELWARDFGRHAHVNYIPPMQCWGVELSLPSDHPQLKLWKEGKLKQATPPTDTVLLHAWSYDTQAWVPHDIEQLGPSGVVSILEKGNTWSGRGEYSSIVEACEAVQQDNEQARKDLSDYAYNVGAEIGSHARRDSLKLPQVGVLTDLTSPPTPTKEK